MKKGIIVEDVLKMNAVELFNVDMYPKDNTIYMVEDEFGLKSITYKNGTMVYNMMIPKDVIVGDIDDEVQTTIEEKSGFDDILKVIAVCNNPELAFKGVK